MAFFSPGESLAPFLILDWGIYYGPCFQDVACGFVSKIWFSQPLEIVLLQLIVAKKDRVPVSKAVEILLFSVLSENVNKGV